MKIGTRGGNEKHALLRASAGWLGTQQTHRGPNHMAKPTAQLALTSDECSRKLKFLLIPCLSSATSEEKMSASHESSSQSLTSVYVTPTVLREFPAANQPCLESPFQERENTSALKLAGEWRSKEAYILFLLPEALPPVSYIDFLSREQLRTTNQHTLYATKVTDFTV